MRIGAWAGTAHVSVGILFFCGNHGITEASHRVAGVALSVATSGARVGFELAFASASHKSVAVAEDIASLNSNNCRKARVSGMPPNLLAHYPYLWEPTVVRQAIETAWTSVSSGRTFVEVLVPAG
jgi:hypothetical protein